MNAQCSVTPNHEVRLGNCLELMAEIDSGTVDAAVTDPPYGLEFMGNSWDGGDGFRRSLNTSDTSRDSVFGRASRTSPEYRAGYLFQEFTQAWATEVLRVLKPGGHLLSFGGARTYHRMATGIEDAGFDIRDQIMWVHGQGFPKSKNLKDDWDGWGTSLKPAHEPIVVARKPLNGTVQANAEQYGTGALNIADCRVGSDGVSLGRWPANLIHDGSEAAIASFPDAPGQLANASMNSEARKMQNCYGVMCRGRKDEPSAGCANVGEVGLKMRPGMRRLDSGSASRFFYCAKASKKERGLGNNHPTVKPINLMRYLCRLVTPPNGLVLDPFTGSGTTGIAASREGFSFLGFERREQYVEIARTRIQRAWCPRHLL